MAKKRGRIIIDKKITKSAKNFFVRKKRKCRIVAVLMLTGIMAGEMKFSVFALEDTDSLCRQQETVTYVSSEIAYELEGGQEAPEHAALYLNGEAEGKTQELSLVGGKEVYREWKDGFCFPITVTGYDGDIFLLGDVKIDAGEELLHYKKEFLEYLGLSEDYYQIDEIQWTGETYEREGMLCRNALAKGKKLMRYVNARYGGNVRLLKKAMEEVTETLEEETETALEPESRENVLEIAEQELSLFDKILRWFKEHLTIVSVSILFLLGIILSIFWILKSKKEESRD